MKTSIAIATLVSVLAFHSAAATENYKEKTFNADTKETFATVSTDVRQQMQKGNRYEYVKPDERVQVEQKLTEMAGFFDESATVQAMKEDTKIKLFNDQEVVNSILTKRDRDRVICKKDAPIGSHIPVTSCHTYGQEEDARHGTRQQLEAWKQEPCMSAPTGGKAPSTCYMGPAANH